jgi:hypothetical protein
MFVYLGNILVATEDQKTHSEHVMWVFTLLGNFGMRQNREKCTFLQTSTELYRYKLSVKVICILEERLIGPSSIKKTENMYKMRQYFEFAIYLKKVLPLFSD